ncbi:MAG: hypothetical protein C4K47_00595 [Candidatus Thorarchaeota archaeon]|nr:MAG: hypothetical protein C4K47_00595 [Candidatus Thorarchaeota archaeon]
MEWMAFQSGASKSMTELVCDYILVRRPSLPRWWDPVARPHVAVIVEDAIDDSAVRYYLSRTGCPDRNGRVPLEISDIESLPEGSLLEVRYNTTKANLYRLELIDNVPCWRWVGRCRGLSSFESEMVDWTHLLDDVESYRITGLVPN